MKSLKFMIVAAATGLIVSCSSAEPTKLWEIGEMKNPESVLPSADGTFVYISNVNGSPLDKDGNGYISKVSLDGKLRHERWATGLDAPKGMALVGTHLYVTNIDELVKIDTTTGAIVTRFPAKDAKFLNDVAATPGGDVYVSDSFTNTIWRLSGVTFEPWVTSDDLHHPNGLLVEGDNLIVAGFGALAGEDTPAVPAGLIKVSLKDKTVSPLGNGKPVGNLDGLESVKPGVYLVSDWGSGALYKIYASGAATTLIDLDKGSADIGYVSAARTVLIPMMLDNKVVAYQLP